MNQEKHISIWSYILFPALAMMLGWGLRGHIGGGPFGAMIPGAMVSLSMGLLLRLPARLTSVLVVFSVFGIGLGGEMTYGQTLGFLRNPDTVWWGLAGTTLKGGVWGLLGGTVLSLGFLYDRISKRTILIGLVIMMVGFLIGFKLINDPMILYFSDPAKPRSESWAALLLGAITLLAFMQYRLSSQDFNLIRRFSFYGLIGGGLGFGLGSLWIVLGSRLPDVLFTNWWKAMEFSFGFLLGGSLGLAAWKSRKKIGSLMVENGDNQHNSPLSYAAELSLLVLLALVIHAFIPYTLELFIERNSGQVGIFTVLTRELARLVINYGFYGILMVFVLIRIPRMAWQIGITLTFTHAAIDLVRDFYPDRNIWNPVNMHFFWVALMTLTVALLTAYYHRHKNRVENLFLLLIWSCIAVSLLRLYFLSGSLSISGMSFSEVIFDRYFVDLYFVVCAVILTWIILRIRGKENDVAMT